MIRFDARSEAERRLLEREEAEEEEEEMDNLAEQANHSATVAHLHYGLGSERRCWGGWGGDGGGGMRRGFREVKAQRDRKGRQGDQGES